MFPPAPELYEQAKRKALLLESGYYEAVDVMFRRVSGNYCLYRTGSAFRTVLEHYERMKKAISRQMQRIQAEIWAAETDRKHVRTELEEEYRQVREEINLWWEDFVTDMQMSDLSVKKHSFESAVESRATDTVEHIEKGIEMLRSRTSKDFLRNQNSEESFHSDEKRRFGGAYRVTQGLQYGVGGAAIAFALGLATPALGAFRKKFFDSPAERREKREAERKQLIREYANEQKAGMLTRAENVYNELFSRLTQDMEEKVSAIRRELDRAGRVFCPGKGLSALKEVPGGFLCH